MSEIHVEVLSKILLIQKMLCRFPDRESLLHFICQGIAELPGVDQAEYSEVQHNVFGESNIFPISQGDTHYGDILLRFYSYEEFKPYAEYIHNICFMTALIIEDRDQYIFSGQCRRQLEREVLERTLLLSREKERSELYLKVAEAVILELDVQGHIVVLNKRGIELLECSFEEVRDKNWFDLFIAEDQLEMVKDIFRRLVQGEEDIEYCENDIISCGGKRLHIMWHNVVKYDFSGKIVGTISSGQDITQRKLAEEATKLALQEKEVLLRELYHRTRNNMQVISGMIMLQAEASKNEEVVRILSETNNRIQSMALVHKKLYQSGNLSRLDLAVYLNDLVALLTESYVTESKNIEFIFQVEPLAVQIETAIPCGLVLNELITNALKYAFPGEQTGFIKISLKKDPGGEITLEVKDNGVGVPGNFHFRKQQSLGMQLIFNIAEYQLQGNVHFWVERGLGCRILFRTD